MPSILVIVAAGLAIAVGAMVQSGAGLGLGLIGSPLVTLLDPALMPGSLLVAGMVLPVFVLVRELRHADWPGVSWALAGRLAGTVAGVWVIASVSPRVLGVIIGSVVLAVTAVTVAWRALPRNPWTLLTAGVISGTSGTATSIGGPPVALLYAGGSGPQVRASLSAFLMAGNTLAVAALAASGHLPGRDVAMGAIFLAFATAGFALAARLRRFLDGGRIRAAVLAIAAASAAVLVA
ncbi:MAG: sulfite exporter TauE/SafE family protein, partial [Actinobacteria bacterium]|nr:sulfite exporter TauE/SafE family protein [Actinomycetota bacterium]